LQPLPVIAPTAAANAAAATAAAQMWFDPQETVLGSDMQRSLLQCLQTTPPPLPPQFLAHATGTDAGDADEEGDGGDQHYSRTHSHRHAHSHRLASSSNASLTRSNGALERLTSEADSLPILLRIQPIAYDICRIFFWIWFFRCHCLIAMHIYLPRSRSR
jgi:hypothetical protein